MVYGEKLIGEEEKVLPVVTQWNPREVDKPVPLNCLLPDQSYVSDWVFNKVKEIQHYVAVECEGYEEQFMALHAAIKCDHTQVTNSASKKQWELKRLMWSLASCDRSQGKGIAISLMECLGAQ